MRFPVLSCRALSTMEAYLWVRGDFVVHGGEGHRGGLERGVRRREGCVSGQVGAGGSVPVGGIETFRLSVGGCPCYQRIVNVCGARRAPALPGRFPTPGDHGPLRPAAPEVGPRGCPPPLGLTAPLRRGGSFPVRLSFDEGRRDSSLRSAPGECILFYFWCPSVVTPRGLRCTRGCGACGRTCFSITLGAAWPGEDARPVRDVSGRQASTVARRGRIAPRPRRATSVSGVVRGRRPTATVPSSAPWERRRDRHGAALAVVAHDTPTAWSPPAGLTRRLSYPLAGRLLVAGSDPSPPVQGTHP